MDSLLPIVQKINNVMWNTILIYLLCGTGIYFSIRLKFIQVTKFKAAFKHVFGNMHFGKKADKNGMSSFQSLATAIAAQVGTGNLAGAATAMVSGGPGAIFWMWVSAFFGMSTIFSEAVLAQKFKKKVDGQVTGGPAYYIQEGLNCRWLAVLFSLLSIVTLGFIGAMVQSNSIGDAFYSAFGINAKVTGIVLAIVAGFIFIGGISRIASFTEKVVPFMAVFYIIGGLFILVTNYSMIIPAFKSIFVGAFNPDAVLGGVLGVTVKNAMRYGIARGLFSNEAGMGSTPHAHAVAVVDHPAQQGLSAMVGVFIDTFIVLTMTALVILTTGVLDGSSTGISLTQKAFTVGMGSIGNGFVAVTLLFFAFSTIIGWYFFAEANVKFLFKGKYLTIFRIIAMFFIFLGACLKVDLVWELTDTFNGLMVFPNLIGVLLLSPIVIKTYKDYLEKKDALKL